MRMTPVITTGNAKATRQRPKPGSGSITAKKVLFLVFVTSLAWFLLNLVAIHLYSNQGGDDNNKLPLDGGPGGFSGDTGAVANPEHAAKDLRKSFAADTGNARDKNVKPKLTRLLDKQAGRDERKLVHLTKAKKEVPTDGFHSVKRIDSTSFPRNASGVGERGARVDLGPEQQKQVDAQWSRNYFNGYLSDKISVERSLPDFRDEGCNELNISNNLPKTSVIMCFCEESWSTLLRSVHSVLNRSPPELIEEVILIDDFSQSEKLKEPLDKYMARFPKVKVVHLKERHGLVRARLVGVEMSKASVLTFLDSHIECMVGWLEPLLQRVHEDRRNVVSPIIDSIDATTFQMKKAIDNIGSFTWSFTFTWIPMPEHERNRRERVAEPIRTPTMAGGLFSIDKSFFNDLGTYDQGFDVWGAENMELSLKTWMCGGQLEILPCSRVGHIFRKKQPYSFPKNDNIGTFRHNTLRMVEVWVDEPYKRIFYDHEPSLNGANPGDLEERKSLRQILQCKSFQWYLDNVHPGKKIPTFKYKAWGSVASVANKICLDNMGNRTIAAYSCHGVGQSQGGPIIDKASGKCLQLVGTEEKYTVKFENCNNNDNQKWIWDHYFGEREDEL